MQKRGASLVSVMLLSGVGVLLTLTVAGVSISHLGFSNQIENSQRARLAAEAASHQLMARICEDPHFGSRPDASGFFPGQQIDLDGAVGSFHFDPRRTDQPCLNNLHSQQLRQGWRRNVPGYSLQILSQGSYRNQSCWLETMVTIPPYPNAIATSGELHSRGGLNVLGVDDPNDLERGLENIPRDRVKPGHVAANSPSSAANQPAMDLQATASLPSRITGDAKSVGSLRCDPTHVIIEGSPRPGAEPAPIPRLDFSSYDPVLLGNGYQNLSYASLDSGANVSTAVRRQGNLTIRGGLRLDNGFLYVDGNLRIEGGIQGKGVVVSTQNVTIEGASVLNSTAAVGLMARGDLQMTGSAREQSQMNRSTFRGVVYTEGNFQASNVQLVGALLGNSQSAEGSRIELENVNVVHNPSAINVVWNNGWQPSLGAPSDYLRRPRQWAQAAGLDPDDFDPVEIVFNHQMFPLRDLRYTPEQLQALSQDPNNNKLPDGLDQIARGPDGEWRLTFPGQADHLISQQLSSPGHPVGYAPKFPYDRDGNGGDSLGLPMGAGLSSDPLLRETPWYHLVRNQVERMREGSRLDASGNLSSANLDGSNHQWWLTRWDGNGMEDQPMGTNGPGQFLWGIRTASGRVFNSPCDFVTHIYDSLAAQASPNWGTKYDPAYEDLTRRYQDEAFHQLALYDQNYRDYLHDLSRRNGILAGGVSLDPNQFIQFQDRLRRVLVRQVFP